MTGYFDTTASVWVSHSDTKDEKIGALTEGLRLVAWSFHCQYHNPYDGAYAVVPKRFNCSQYPCLGLDLDVFPTLDD